MQFSGSFLQSMLHLNLSQASHPIGGVLASPLSKPSPQEKAEKRRTFPNQVIIDLQREKNSYLFSALFSPSAINTASF